MKIINLDEIITNESKKFKAPIESDGLQLLIINCCKEFGKQLLELAVENAKLKQDTFKKYENYKEYCKYAATFPNRYDMYGDSYAVDVFEINKQSILEIINQVE